MNNILSIIFMAWVMIVILPGFINRLARGKIGGKLERRQTIVGTKIVNYIFPGTLYPASDYFDPYVANMVGDVNIVHPGHKEYDPEAMAKLVANDVHMHSYDDIRLITFSLGDRMTAPIGKELKDEVSRGKVRVWTVDPCPTSEFIKPSLLWTLRILTPFVTALRVALGWLAEIPFISRDGHKNSIAEIEGFLFEMAYDSRSYFNQLIFNFVTVAIEDDEVFYEPPRLESHEIDESGETITTSSIVTARYGVRHLWNHKGSSLCNISDSNTATGYHSIFELTGLYSR